MDLFVVVGLLAIVCLIAAVALTRRRRLARVMNTDVLLSEVMMRRGLTPADAAAAGRERELFAATSRCAVCAVDSACRIALGKSGTQEVPHDCPNRAFLGDVSAHKASLPAEPPRLLDNNLQG